MHLSPASKVACAITSMAAMVVTGLFAIDLLAPQPLPLAAPVAVVGAVVSLIFGLLALQED